MILILLLLNNCISQKIINLNDNELNILILGDFGLSEEESSIKKNVVRSIKNLHSVKKFNLGLILGDNVYPLGSSTGDFQRLDEIFSLSFPKTDFDFDFLAILGNHEYYGNIETQMDYFKKESRFYLPERFFEYVVVMPSKKIIHFVGVDSTPIIETALTYSFNFVDQFQTERVENMFKSRADATFTFLLSHHNVKNAFGPHKESPEDNFLNALTEKYNIQAVFSGHNHNMQYLAPKNNQKSHHIVIGNSAKTSRVTSTSKLDTKDWYYDQKGGFGRLIVSDNLAKLEYFDEHGHFLKSIDIHP